MNTTLEFEGKDVENAVEKACDELSLPRKKIKYAVISNGSSGIFGLVGAKKAKIRVVAPVNKTDGSKKDTSHQDDQINQESHKDGARSLVDEAFNSHYTSNNLQPNQVAQEISKQKNVTSMDDTADQSISISEEALNLGKSGLQKIVDLITTGAKISVKQNAGRVTFDVAGGNSGILIGKRGQTLEAIQYLVDRIVNKRTETRVRIEVDIEGYLETKRNALKKLAYRLAEKTKLTGKPSAISKMNAHDRRIIHLALKDNTWVKTQSVGEGYYRKLMIISKKNNHRNQKRSPEER